MKARKATAKKKPFRRESAASDFSRSKKAHAALVRRNEENAIKRICFVTGTRAEFGLMVSTLREIQSHPKLQLQIVVTGMHLDRRHGRTIDQIRREGWSVDAVVPWPKDRGAAAVGTAIAGLSRSIARLKSDVVLVVGDRVEAFAAAAAAHIDRRVVAHVHGGDRALGQVDDSLRHAISKLAHVHFPATEQSARRLLKLGESEWRIHQVGSPGLDGMRQQAASPAELARQYPDLGQFVLIVLHPTESDEAAEFQKARALFRAVEAAGDFRLIIVWPNNDPGHGGIVRFWQTIVGLPGIQTEVNLPRPIFLGLMRQAVALVGNSSSGIIEAASFGTPVIDIGERQSGRERGENVTTVPFKQHAISQALKHILAGKRPPSAGTPGEGRGEGSARRSTQHDPLPVARNPHPNPLQEYRPREQEQQPQSLRYQPHNIYGRGNTGKRIAHLLAGLSIDAALFSKIITY